MWANRKLTDEQKIWFLDRLTEQASGRLTIKQHVADKYRKVTGDFELSNADVLSELIDLYNYV